LQAYSKTFAVIRRLGAWLSFWRSLFFRSRLFWSPSLVAVFALVLQQGFCGRISRLVFAAAFSDSLLFGPRLGLPDFAARSSNRSTGLRQRQILWRDVWGFRAPFSLSHSRKDHYFPS